MLISHKIELSPNNKHATYFAQAAGVARFAYNWGLENWKEKFPWMLDVTKNASIWCFSRYYLLG